jgi:hypothetical protein
MLLQRFALFNLTAYVDAPLPYPGFRGRFFPKFPDTFWEVFISSLDVVLETGTFY